EWELLGQAEDGQVVVLRTEQDLGEVQQRAARLGFTRPSGDADSGAVWVGGPSAIAEVPGLATYELQNLAFLVDEGILLASDNTAYLDRAVEAAKGDADGLDVDDLLAPLGDPLAATVLVGDRACAELGLGTADEIGRAHV